MRRRLTRLRRALLPASLLFICGPGACGVPVAQDAVATRTRAPIVLDGRLDEAPWAAALPLDRFFETYPGSLVEAPEATRARFLYDDENLYIGLDLPLQDPRTVRTPFVRRDKVNSTQDYIQVYLDPQGQRRGSSLFRVNARGNKTDGYQDELQGSESLDPDYAWDAATRVGEHGWTAELRIPLSTLRIPGTPEQRWTIIVTRGVPRGQNTQMASAPFPHDSNCFLCHAGTLAFPDLRTRSQHLLVTPGFTATSYTEDIAHARGNESSLHASLDAKWIIGGDSVLDLTLHPDYSQVEAAPPQLTGNRRFPALLLDKRPFFREGADLVSTLVKVVDTRTMVALDAGLRFTHRSPDFEATTFVARDIGRGTIVEPGFLASEEARPEVDADVAFARVRGPLANGSVGAIAAIKRNEDGSGNRVGGIDATWADSQDRVGMQWLASDTREPSRPDLLPAWTGVTRHGTGAIARWDHSTSQVWSLRYEQFDDDFRSWLGHVPRVGYRLEHVEYFRPFYRRAGALSTIEPYALAEALQGINGHDGRESDRAVGLVLAGSHALAADVSWHAGQVLDTAGKGHDTHAWQWSASASPWARLPLVSFGGTHGRAVEFASGRTVPATTVSLRAVLRPVDRLDIEAQDDRVRLASPDGADALLREATTRVVGNWHFSPRLYAQATWQRHDAKRPSGAVATVLRALQFNWDASTAWQVYWGVRESANRLAIGAPAASVRELYIKASWTFSP